MTGKEILYKVVADLVEDEEITWIKHLSGIGRKKFADYPAVLIEELKPELKYGEMIDHRTDKLAMTVIIRGLNDNDLDETKYLDAEKDLRRKSEELIKKVYEGYGDYEGTIKMTFGEATTDDFIVSSDPVMFCVIPVDLMYDAKLEDEPDPEEPEED